MIKFESPELQGYGFDLAADRVVRFNKHPDGTYLNTRATYSINNRQFTHYDLRQMALKDRPLGQMEEQVAFKRHPKWIIILLLLICVVISLSTTQCSVELNSNVVTTESSDD